MKQRNCLLAILACIFAIQGCAVKQYAISSLGDVLSQGGDLYSSDDDIELVGQALPFGLKTIEALLAEVPDHRRLLVSAASGFTRYSYAYVDLQAFELEESDAQRSQVLKARAKRLYLRGRDYALRAVELRKADFIRHLRYSPEAALEGFKAEHVPELYWMAVSWAAAIASDKTDMELLADLNLIEPLIRQLHERQTATCNDRACAESSPNAWCDIWP